jgi:hypothetical protein
VSGSIAFLERPEALRLVQTAPAHFAVRGNVAGLSPMVAHLGRETVDVSKTARFLEGLGIWLVLLNNNFDMRCQNSIKRPSFFFIGRLCFGLVRHHEPVYKTRREIASRTCPRS